MPMGCGAPWSHSQSEAERWPGRRAELRRTARAASVSKEEGSMQVLRKLRRPRWLAAVALCGGGRAGRLRRQRRGVARTARRTSQAAPVVDRDYIYGQLFDMSYNDVYRVSGADGVRPRTGGRDPFNVPVDGQRLAGVLPALEGAAHRQEGDDATSRSSRPSRDHYFRRLPEQRTNPNYYASTPTTSGTRTTPRSRSRRGVPGPARAARRASRRDAGQPGDRRRGQQPAELDQRRVRLRRRPPRRSRSATSPTAAPTTTRRASR